MNYFNFLIFRFGLKILYFLPNRTISPSSVDIIFLFLFPPFLIITRCLRLQLCPYSCHFPSDLSEAL